MLIIIAYLFIYHYHSCIIIIAVIVIVIVIVIIIIITMTPIARPPTCRRSGPTAKTTPSSRAPRRPRPIPYRCMYVALLDYIMSY